MSAASAAGPGIEIDWAALARPEALPHDPSAAAGVEWIQTHLSHVFLTRDFVYKFRKPVDLGFLCFTSRDERNADCLREVALNRRLAPDVYRGVAPLCDASGRLVVGRYGEELASGAEHCVVMRRLPEGRDALSLLEAGELSVEHLDALARRIARFHAEVGLGQPAPFTPAEWRERCLEPVAQNFRALAVVAETLGIADSLARAHGEAGRFAERHADRFERRRQAGRAVSGHGDLHLQHIWYEAERAEPLAIDCLEFSETLRCIDAASEVAFPAMDLRYRGAPELAEHFLAAYAQESDDFGLYSVVDYFVAYRAAVRGKVAALAARDVALPASQRRSAEESARRHLALAGEALLPRPRPALVLMAGSAGTGKSSVARELARPLGAVVIASDRVRKCERGVAATQRLGEGWGRGAYAPEARAQTYQGLIARARPVLGAGRSVILDATFGRREWRGDATALARELGAQRFLVEVVCEPERVRARVAARAREDRDASDAGPESIERSAAEFEPLGDWPGGLRTRLDTGRECWRGQLSAILRRIELRLV